MTQNTSRQLTSGRWLLTVASGMCLLMITLAAVLAPYFGKAPFVTPEALLSVIVMVFMSYFQKPPAAEGGKTEVDGPMTTVDGYAKKSEDTQGPTAL